MIRTALALAEKNMAVFPCRPQDKRPATANGLKDATTDVNIIRQWWRQEPQFNLAIATGAVSGIFVVDVDGLDAEVELRRLEAQHGTLPSTVEAITARGRHCYFRLPDAPVRNSAGKIAPGVDVRGDGGYVLAPPSVHPTGKRYAWSVDCASAFAEAPAWLIDKVVLPAKGVTPPLPPEAWRELFASGAAEGKRDHTITKLAGHLLRHRVDPFVCLDLLQSWNVTKCAPPLPDTDIERIVNSVAGRELRRRADA
jgi:Bifunctional DNA primase/polymerase, N-terminal/Primase C terminal 1 (PriCT-1)